MLARIRDITIDCRDPRLLARFWAGVLGYVEAPDADEDDTEVRIVDPMARHPGLLFIAVPEPKTAKNRVHLDLMPELGRDVTVEAIVGLGATLVADRRQADGTGWAVMADPEGNELCVLRSAAERGVAPPQDSGDDVQYPDGIRVADEAGTSLAMLEWYREAVVRKLTGISLETMRTSPVRSGTTIAGLVKHLALVEDSWFTDRFAGEDDPEPWRSAPFDDDADWDFHSAVDDSIEDLIDLYEAACARSRAIIASHSLDDMSAYTTRPFTLRFAVVHLIEETARHLGHMDILREFLDGSIGE